MEGGASEGVKNDVVDDTKARVRTRVSFEVNVRESNMGHGEHGLVQWAVNSVAFRIVNDVGNEGVSSPVVSTIFEFVDDYRIRVLVSSCFDCL